MCDTCAMLILDRDLALNRIIFKSQQVKVPQQFIRARPDQAPCGLWHADGLGDPSPVAIVLALEPAEVAQGHRDAAAVEEPTDALDGVRVAL
jgi:hypothetical protein